MGQANEKMSTALHNLVFVVQLGLDLALPLVLGVMGASWLRNRFGLGNWIVLLGIVLGLLGAVGGFLQFYRIAMARSRKKGENGNGPVGTR